MTGRGMHRRAGHLYAVAVVAAIGVLLSTKAQAQEFELHPGWIEGTVQLGNSTITYGSVYANGCDANNQCHNASTQLVLPSGGGSTGTFRLTVEGGITYSVSSYLNIPNMNVYLPSSQVTVAVGETQTLNRTFPNWAPGTVHGTVTVTGGTLQGGYVSGSAYNSTTGISAYSYGSISSVGSYSYSVGPGEVSQYSSVIVGGNNYPLPYKTFSMPGGGDVEVNYSLDIGAPGTISGTISVNGGFVDYFYVYAYGPGSFRYAYIYGADGSFRFDDLAPGNWSLYAYAYDTLPDQATRAYGFPYQSAQVTAQQDTAVSFNLDPGFIDGTLTVGNYGQPYSSWFSISGQTTDSGPCCPGAWFSKGFYSYTGDTLPSSLSYGLFVDPARRWSVRSWSVSNSYSENGSYSYNSVYGYVPDAPEITLDPGEHVTQDFSQFNFNTGTLTLRMRVAGGGPFQNPYVNGYGTRESQSGAYLYSTYANGNGQVQQTDAGHVGTVTLTLAPGKYTFDAYGYVEGSWTSFGRFTATIDPGVIVDQDLSAPTLTVNAPDETCSTKITVSGTASDPSGVAYVKVNGVEVTVDGNGNWSTDVTLAGGSNTIVVEAADTGDNKITITRTVSRLGCNQPPVANAGGPYMTTEGTAVTLSAAGSSDPDGDSLTFEWDLDNDGTFETTGVTASFMRADDFSGQVMVRVSDGQESSTAAAQIVVSNVAPTAAMHPRAMVTYDATLRFAGQPGDILCLQVTQAGASAGGGCATRQTGSPDEQLLQVNFTVNLLEPYSAVLTFDTSSKKSGATPVWSMTNGQMEKLTTFVTKPSDPSTYQQSLALAGFSTHFSAAGRNVTFSGAGSDPGADAVMFTWSFGDGASATSSHTGPGTFSDTQTHSFPAAGSYTVQLTVSDDDGGAGHDQITVIVP